MNEDVSKRTTHLVDRWQHPVDMSGQVLSIQSEQMPGQLIFVRQFGQLLADRREAWLIEVLIDVLQNVDHLFQLKESI